VSGAPAKYAALLDLPMTATERTAIEALVEYGSQNAAADALGWKRTKLQSRLRSVQARAARAAEHAPEIPEAPPLHGAVAARAAHPAAPPGARVARYILTAAQNNTPVHAAFLANLEAYAEATGARIMVSRFSYNKSAYRDAKSTKAGRAPTAADTEGLWYDPAIAPYVCDDPARHGSCRWELAPASASGDGGLLWCAEMNILPTAVRPLSGLESYSGPASGIFPHAKIALESVPVIGDRPPKFNYTTGAVTQRNYVAKKEGIKAEHHHQYGALFVEVDLATGDWWARQLNATDDGSFYDLTRRVSGGKVTLGHRLLAFNPGDVHAAEIDPTTRACLWAPGGALDILMPKYQFWHDTFSHRNRSHHELKSFEARFAKWVAGAAADSVEHEVRVTAELLSEAYRPWCQTLVVSSNHDRHIDRWLDEADYKQDPVNAEFFLAAQLARVRIIRELGPRRWDALHWALERCWLHANEARPIARFLGRDESFRIGPPGHEIECGSHGDEGPNGARGNAGNLARIPIRMNVGHAHSACLREGLAQAGVCHRPKQSSYAHGASSWSTSHIFTYQNGKRAIATERGGKLWL
jgi:hypothetical protein